MRKVKLNVDRLAVESFPTVSTPPKEARGTILAHAPTYCPFTDPLPATYEFDTCDQPSGACPPESCV
jgi:hypothetical protein